MSRACSKHPISIALSSCIWKWRQLKGNSSAWLSLETLIRVLCCHYSTATSLLDLQETSKCQQPWARTDPAWKQRDVSQKSCSWDAAWRLSTLGTSQAHPALPLSWAWPPWGIHPWGNTSNSSRDRIWSCLGSQSQVRTQNPPGVLEECWEKGEKPFETSKPCQHKARAVESAQWQQKQNIWFNNKKTFFPWAPNAVVKIGPNQKISGTIRF